MASLGSFTTTELKTELDRRANPKYREILFEHVRFLEEEVAKGTPEALHLHVCIKRIKTRLKENHLPLED